MNIRSAFITWITSTLLFLLYPVALNAKPESISEKYVLIINSYTEAAQWSQCFINPIYKEFLEENTPLTICTEHMRMLATINSEEDVQRYSNLLLSKYKEPPALVIFLGNSSWRLLIEDMREKWGDIPTVLCAEQDYVGPKDAYIHRRPILKEERESLEKANAGYPLTVLHIPFYIKENLEFIHQVIPNLKHLIFLSDLRTVGQEARMEMKEDVAKEFPDLKVTYLTPATVSVDSLRKITHAKMENTAILFLSWFIKDPNYGSVISSGISKIIGANSLTPLFALDDEGEEENGILGGCYFDEEKQGEMILNIIRGAFDKGQSGYTIIQPATPDPLITYPSVEYFRLSEKAFPANTVFLLKPPSFFEAHLYLLLSMGIATLFFVAWIIWLNKIRRTQKDRIISMQEHSSILENMPIAYIKQKLIFDSKNHITDYITQQINPYYEKLLGASEASSTIGRKGSSNEHIDFEKVIHFYNIIYTTKKVTWLQYYHKLAKRHINVIVSPSARTGYMDIFLVDQTELSAAQEKLRSANHKLSLALDVANIVPWKWDLANKTILCDVNRPIELLNEGASEEQLSVSQELYFKNIMEEDKDRVRKAYQSLIAGNTPKINEQYKVRTKKNGVLSYDWVEAKAVVDQRDNSGKALSLVGSSMVITERKNMENDLVNAKQKAEESNRLKSAFLANMSHEIRTPLNAIIGFSEILPTAQSEEEKNEYIHIIQNNNTLLLQLIGDILDLSKIEAGTLEFHYKEIDLNILFRELETSIQTRHTNPDVVVSYIPETPDCYAITEKNRITQVMINFLNNAMKFTKEGSIRFGYRLQGQQIYFYVTDTGQGISGEQQRSIFERFVKLNHFAQGTGLGLPICKSIVECMQGEIGVESEVGRGSTFWFTIPYQPATRQEKKQMHYAPQIDSRDKKVTILIAEDNESNFKLFDSILKNNYHIVHAWDGEEAVKMFSEHHPHIVLMDINMPKMNGYEATNKIREISAMVPIVAVTAFAFAEDEKRILESGFNAYTSKPVNANKLHTQINDLLSKFFVFL